MSAPHGPGQPRPEQGAPRTAISGTPERLFMFAAIALGGLVYLVSFLDGADLVFRGSPLASPLLVLTALIIGLAMSPDGPRVLPVAVLTSMMGSLSVLHIGLTVERVGGSVLFVLLLGFAQTTILVWAQLARLGMTKLPSINAKGGGSRGRGGNPPPWSDSPVPPPGWSPPQPPHGHPGARHGGGDPRYPGPNPSGPGPQGPNTPGPGMPMPQNNPTVFLPPNSGQPGAREPEAPSGTRRYSPSDLPDPNGPLSRPS